MNEEQLKQISTQLNIDFLVLQKIFNRFRPKDRTELLKITNEIVGLQGQLNTQDIDGVINYYESMQGEENTQNELVEPIRNTIEDQQPVQTTQIDNAQQPQIEVPQEDISTQQSAPTPPFNVVGQPNQQIQPQSASVNFESKYGQGFQFRPQGSDDLTGQCAWFAQQVTTLPDGSNWTIGNTIQQKQQQLQGHRRNGNGFLKGEGQPEVGNSVVLDTGTQYGHVAVVSEVLPDGRIRLTESNWDNDQRVRHDRIIDPNDKSVVGFVKSKPTREFKIEPPKTPPTLPTTPDTAQEEISAPQGKQELPLEKQPIKQENLEQSETIDGPDQQSRLIDQQNIENKTVQQIQDDFTDQISKPNKNIGFLDVFSKNGQIINPTQFNNDERSINQAVTAPSFQQMSKPTQIRRQDPTSPQSATVQIRQQQVVQPPKIAQPAIQRQPVVPKTNIIQRQMPILNTPQPIQRQIKIPTPVITQQRVSLSQKQTQPSQIKNLISRVAGFFRR